MTIDPMAAVSAATGGVGNSAVADPAASANPASSQPDPASSHQGVSQVRVADEGAKVDLYDYTSQHQNKPPAIDTLAPESKAKYLSNPAALGEKVLERMESLHQRSMEYRSQGLSGGTSAADGGGQSVLSGPASTDVAGSSAPTDGTAKDDQFSRLSLVFDYAVESTLISSSSQQFVSSVNTLMKGQ